MRTLRLRPGTWSWSWTIRAGTTRDIGIPVKLSVTPGPIRRPAPVLVEHTDEVLAEHGYSAVEIKDFRNTGVMR